MKSQRKFIEINVCSWSQELLPETEIQLNVSSDCSVDQTIDVSSVAPFQLSPPTEERNNDQRTEKILTTRRTRNPQNWKGESTVG